MQNTNENLSVITFLWNDGVRTYLPEHVNFWAKSVKEHFSLPHRRICVCDEQLKGFSDDVEIVALPKSAEWVKTVFAPKHPRLPSSYRRLWAFSKEAKCLGDRILLLDIDCLIVRDLAPLFNYKEDFVGWRPASEDITKVKSATGVKRIAGGTWLLRTGTHTHIWENFSAKGVREASKAGWRGSDQAWLSYNLAATCKVFNDDCGIYHSQDGAKKWNELPNDARIIHFNGAVKPWDEEVKARPWMCKLLGVPYEPHKWAHLNRRKRGRGGRPPRKVREERAMPLDTPLTPEERTPVDFVMFWWDKWPDGSKHLGNRYIKILTNRVQANVPDWLDYRIILFTNDPIVKPEGLEVRKLGVPDSLRWNLKKMYMYSNQANLRETVICLDLDTVILGSLEKIITVAMRSKSMILTCKGAFKKRRIGGSLVSFHPSSRHHNKIWMPVVEDRHAIEMITHGSERAHYNHLFRKTKGVNFWEKEIPGQVVSFKKDCRKHEATPQAALVRFHGTPRPHEAEVEWVKKFWK